MADFEFNLQDITNLAQKLGAIQQDLTEQEHMLLLAIFAAAAARAVVTNPVTSTSTLPEPEITGQGPHSGGHRATLGELQQQLLNAYIPGNSFDSAASRTGKIVGMRTPAGEAGNPGPGPQGPPVT